MPGVLGARGLDQLRRPTGRTCLALATFLFMSSVACSPVGPSGSGTVYLDEPLGGTPEIAAQIVQQWFEQARGTSVERGWDLLYPYVRSDIIGSEATYRMAVESVAWETFEYSIIGVQAIDGEYRVQVHVTGGLDRVPPFMTDWGLIQVAPVDGVVGDIGTIGVRIDPAGGPTGIQAVP